jgi:hypothetical protein
LLKGTEVILKTYKSLNPASFLSEEKRKPEHLCEEVLMESYATRSDLTN